MGSFWLYWFILHNLNQINLPMLSIIFSYFANRDADFIKLATAGVRHIVMEYCTSEFHVRTWNINIHCHLKKEVLDVDINIILLSMSNPIDSIKWCAKPAMSTSSI
jgi:hypothetical protein